MISVCEMGQFCATATDGRRRAFLAGEGERKKVEVEQDDKAQDRAKRNGVTPVDGRHLAACSTGQSRRRGIDDRVGAKSEACLLEVDA